MNNSSAARPWQQFVSSLLISVALFFARMFFLLGFPSVVDVVFGLDVWNVAIPLLSLCVAMDIFLHYKVGVQDLCCGCHQHMYTFGINRYASGGGLECRRQGACAPFPTGYVYMI